MHGGCSPSGHRHVKRPDPGSEAAEAGDPFRHEWPQRTHEVKQPRPRLGTCRSWRSLLLRM
eukprot:760628-Alexandrium_andersonii.AAC.1